MRAFEWFKLKRGGKAKMAIGVIEVGRPKKIGPHHRPLLSRTRGRGSMPAETRKTANYACAGRSQGKLWWRLEAVLTCESLARHGYRGERLIERSSSWFPSKFPAG